MQLAETRPGPHELVIVPGEPLGRKSKNFLNATLGTKGHTSYDAYGLEFELTTWVLRPTNSQKPMIEIFHIIPQEGAIIMEGSNVPSSYPINPDIAGSSGKLLFTQLIAESMSGTIKIEYQTQTHGEPTRQKLDFTRYGQLTLHKQDEAVSQEPKPIFHSIEGQSVVIPGYDTSESEIDP